MPPAPPGRHCAGRTGCRWPTGRDAKGVSLAAGLLGQRDLAAVEGAQGQPGQGLQVLRVLGRGAPGHQGGGGQHDARHLGQAHRDHAGVVHRTDLNGAVDAFGDEVGAAVVQHPFHIHLGVAAQVGHQRGDELVLPKGVRRQHAQGAARGVGRAAQVVLHGAPVFQQGLGVGKAAVAVFGQLHHMGGSLQQLDAQAALQRLQAAADGGLAGAQLLGGGRQAAGFDDADKGLHQLDAVGAGLQGWQGVGHTPSV